MTNPIEIFSKQRFLRALIDLNGGMLSALQLKRNDQYEDLLHRAPWLGSDFYQKPGTLQDHLAGEWPCVPFGWVSEDNRFFKVRFSHGAPCHNTWQCVQVDEASSKVVLEYDFAPDYPLAKCIRTIELLEDRVKLHLKVIAKEDCKLPFGVHPCFKVDRDFNQIELEIQGDGVVYGMPCEQDISRLASGQYFKTLHEVPLDEKYHNKDGNGTTVDLSHLPFAYNTEEIAQMLHPQGQAIVRYPKRNLQLTLKWDQDKVPTCLLWMSNYGRNYEPWNGTNCCLGIEPIAGAWDLANLSLEENNPVAIHNVKTTVEFKKDQDFDFDYEIDIATL